MVKVDPASGSTITFFQFLFVALEGLRDYVTWTAPDGRCVVPAITSPLATCMPSR